jgi:glycosyltransferase involved in cell wall biosynthesis
MARIGIDARPLSEPAMSGIPRLVHELLESLLRLDRENEYLLYSHRPLSLVPPSVDPGLHRTGNGRLWGSVWIETALPRRLLRDRVDLFWGTEHILPVWGARGVRMVLTVHDLVPYLFPETMSRRNLYITRCLMPPSVRRADAIVTVSHSTMDDLRRLFAPDCPVMETIHPGTTRRFRPVTDRPALAEKLARELNLRKPYLLGVGTLEPRKNARTTIRAFSLLADRIPHDLVLAGSPGWKMGDLRDEISQSPWRERIRWTGRVSDESLADLYAGAEVFVFPSLGEGFGFPLVEAMASGVPVVASRVSSLPEVTGDAAVLVDPLDTAALAGAILSLLQDSSKRAEMISRGLARATQFSWDKAAEEMLGVFRRVLTSPSR